MAGASAALENRLRVVTHERDNLRRQLHEVAGIAEHSHQEKKEAKVLLANVTRLFGELESELAVKFGTFDREQLAAAARRDAAEKARIAQSEKEQDAQRQRIKVRHMDRTLHLHFLLFFFVLSKSNKIVFFRHISVLTFMATEFSGNGGRDDGAPRSACAVCFRLGNM